MYFTKENPNAGPFESHIVPMTKDEALQKMAQFEARGWQGPLAQQMREGYKEELMALGYIE